jgi:RNA polymerase-binding transcription factor DksA
VSGRIAAVRELLCEERETTLARIGAMTGEFDEIVSATAGANVDDEHDPEGSTIAFERARIANLAREAREAGSYWICERCGGPIADERLAARPATRSCIRCAAGPTAATT